MRAALSKAINSGCFSFALFAQAADRPTPSTLGTAAQKQSEGAAAFMELATTWWIWLGLIVLIGLIGVLVYLRSRPDED
jgi:hypothetical protein